MPSYIERKEMPDGRIRYAYNKKITRTKADGSVVQYNAINYTYKSSNTTNIKDITTENILTIDKKRMPYKKTINTYIMLSKNKTLLKGLLLHINEITGETHIYVKPRTKDKYEILNDGRVKRYYNAYTNITLPDGTTKEYEYRKSKIYDNEAKAYKKKSTLNTFICKIIRGINDNDKLRDIIKFINKNKNTTSEKIKIEYDLKKDEYMKNKTQTTQKLYPKILYHFRDRYDLDGLDDKGLLHMEILTTPEDYYLQYQGFIPKNVVNEFYKFKDRQNSLIEEWRIMNDPNYINLHE